MVVLPNTRQSYESQVVHGKRARTKGVVIHTIEGTDEGAVSWFANPSAGGVGAHIVVGHAPPRVVQLCDLDAVCWHAVGANSEYIGIEHEGCAADSKVTWMRRRKQRILSANRVAYICWHYGLGTPRKGFNVFGHIDFPRGGHHDPGPGFWVGGLYMAACRRAHKNLQRSNGRRWTRFGGNK
jgi:N-acetyl-anhydromuramyl-L-alanine amidase AmpD